MNTSHVSFGSRWGRAGETRKFEHVGGTRIRLRAAPHTELELVAGAGWVPVRRPMPGEKAA